jgi:hypothetical protein
LASRKWNPPGRLARINPNVQFTLIDAMLDDDALFAQIAQHDLVLDCTDNVAVRNQLNAGCFAHKTPLVSGAAIRMEGQISVFTYAEGEPCYRCLSRLFGENALTCVEAGVMAPLVGVIGSLQAMEAIKVLAHYGTPAAGKIVMYDAMTCQFREMKLMRNPGCEVCGKKSGGGFALPPTPCSNVGRVSVSASGNPSDRRPSKRPLPVLLKLHNRRIHRRRGNKLLRHVQRQRDGLAACQQAVQRLTRGFKARGQHF